MRPAVQGRSVLLVGELNPYGSDPDYALSLVPLHASSGRLVRILGCSAGTYMRDHDRVNLCTGRWDASTARVEARRLLSSRRAGTGVVLLGSKVARAFSAIYLLDYRLQLTTTDEGAVALLSLPHPSGLCRTWNDPAEVLRACAAYASLVTWVQSRGGL